MTHRPSISTHRFWPTQVGLVSADEFRAKLERPDRHTDPWGVGRLGHDPWGLVLLHRKIIVNYC